MLENNKEYIVNIESLGYEGEGVAKVDGYPIFIPGVLKGESVRVEIIKAKKKYAYGKLLEIIKKSNERRDPKCINYEKCGGCTLMHLNYEGQLDFKFDRVKDCIKKIGGLDDKIVKYPLGMENEHRYRNKAIFSVGLVEEKIAIGFFSEKTHEIIDMEMCFLQDEEADKIVKIIRRRR